MELRVRYRNGCFVLYHKTSEKCWIFSEAVFIINGERRLFHCTSPKTPSQIHPEIMFIQVFTGTQYQPYCVSVKLTEKMNIPNPSFSISKIRQITVRLTSRMFETGEVHIKKKIVLLRYYLRIPV